MTELFKPSQSSIEIHEISNGFLVEAIVVEAKVLDDDYTDYNHSQVRMYSVNITEVLKYISEYYSLPTRDN